LGFGTGGGWYLVETVCECGGGRFVDDAQDVEASDGACVFGSLALLVVEVGWDGYDGVADSVCLSTSVKK
jgi:hypothetical protein